ncbi:glycosyltransferase family 4 protein [Desulfobacter vibrioformis]|uniref:glycosyltransferase family 4 protein n=1 Tax=Desulfobacter vibrioformis TaxID=34031 RepID=UPI0005526DCF|nr:glycosyltransferase family 4 protein [Desulfobacter vibrioformis]
MNILLVMEQCNPQWASVPLLASHFYRTIRERVSVTLVTHERNRSPLEKNRGTHRIIYIKESSRLKRYYAHVSRITSSGGVNWPLQHALSYPVYAEFNRKVYDGFAKAVRAGQYDLVHVMTPILPRYPVKLVNACQNTPFLLGPVNGGVPFPRGEGFAAVAQKEFAQYNFLRLFTRLIPGYRATYKKADMILSGSTYTKQWIEKQFQIPPGDDIVRLFHENGVVPGNTDGVQFRRFRNGQDRPFHLLFVGRLVAYKGADILLEALHRLTQKARFESPDTSSSKVIQRPLSLTIVGDGPERQNLENLTQKLGLTHIVHFTGWIKQEETRQYYADADLFCFPSIREFGGAVALEAMAFGLPCITPDYAGLAEYVTPDTGFKIFPRSRNYLIEQFAEKIAFLMAHPERLHQMAGHAVERVASYGWDQKADAMIAIYKQLINRKRP